MNTEMAGVRRYKGNLRSEVDIKNGLGFIMDSSDCHVLTFRHVWWIWVDFTGGHETSRLPTSDHIHGMRLSLDGLYWERMRNQIYRTEQR
jgi:hypothetical protein